MNKQALTIVSSAVLFTLTSATSLAAQFTPDRSNPFDAANFEADNYYDKSISDESDVRYLPVGSTAQDFNDLIDALGNNGGVIRLTNGLSNIDYEFDQTISMKSNLRIEIEKDAKIKVNTTELLFDFAAKSKTQTINNVSITSYGGGRPTIDVTSYGTGEIRIAQLGNVENFYVGDFNVKDDHSKFSSVSLNPPASKATDALSVWDSGPRDGVIANITQSTAAAGYGVVQIQTARDVLFKNLNGDGGIALRLETGANLSNEVSSHNAIVDGVWGQDINVAKGLTAVMMSPHGKENKDVFLDNISSDNSAYTLIASRGFVNTGTVRATTSGPIAEGTDCNIDNDNRGTYTNVQVRNVHGNRGVNKFIAQIKSKEFKLYDLMNTGDFAKWQDMTPHPDNESSMGRSINVVKHTSRIKEGKVGGKNNGYWTMINPDGTDFTQDDVTRSGDFADSRKMYYHQDTGKGTKQNLKDCIINVSTNTARLR